ncbi:hypothetical protein C3941_10925 [Kaistia algarum]|nr:hypothetical protein C3941_10925 [Kaistia algarum]
MYELLSGAVSRLPDSSEVTRRQLYAKALTSIENNCRRADGSLDEAMFQTMKRSAEIAAARIEKQFAVKNAATTPNSGPRSASAVEPPRRFAPPDDAPQSAGEYLWLKALGICGAIGTIIDFLKPLASLQSAAFFIGVLLATLCHFAMRLPGATGRRWLKLGRVSGGLVAALMLGLFGMEAVMPGDQPNGLLADTFPPIAALQTRMLNDIQAGLGRVEQTTTAIDATTRETKASADRIEQQTASIADDVRNLADAADPVVAARKAIVAAGFTPDLSGYIAAVSSGSMAQYQFVDTGLPISVEDFEAALLRFRYDTPEFSNFIAGPLVYDSRFRSVRTAFNAVSSNAPKGVLDVSGIFQAACGQGGDSFLDKLYRFNLADQCSDRSAWLEQASGLLKAMGGSLYPRVPTLSLSKG